MEKFSEGDIIVNFNGMGNFFDITEADVISTNILENKCLFFRIIRYSRTGRSIVSMNRFWWSLRTDLINRSDMLFNRYHPSARSLDLNRLDFRYYTKLYLRGLS